MVDVNAEIFSRLLNADQLENITEIWQRVASPLLKEKKGYPESPLWQYFPGKSVHTIPTTIAAAGNDKVILSLTLRRWFSAATCATTALVCLPHTRVCKVSYHFLDDWLHHAESSKHSWQRPIPKLASGLAAANGSRHDDQQVIIVPTTYPLSRPLGFPGQRFTKWKLIFAMLFESGLIPRYLAIRSPGMLNTIWVLMLPMAVQVFYNIAMVNFFRLLIEAVTMTVHCTGASCFGLCCHFRCPRWRRCRFWRCTRWCSVILPLA